MDCPVCEQPNPGADPDNDDLVIDHRSVCKDKVCIYLGEWYLRKLEESDFTVQSAKLVEALDDAA